MLWREIARKVLPFSVIDINLDNYFSPGWHAGDTITSSDSQDKAHKSLQLYIINIKREMYVNV